MSDLSRTLSRLALTAFATALTGTSLTAQTVAGPSAAQAVTPSAAVPAPMQFDVVSVKPNKAETGMIRMMNRPGTVNDSGVTLKMLISQAYNVREDLISGGPGWVGSTAWDLEGKISPADADALKAMSNDDRNAAQRHMMQLALMDRFHLKTHIETKTLPVYDLELAKGGSKLKDADPNAPLPEGLPASPDGQRRGMMRMQPGKVEAQYAAIPGLINILARNLERTVIDMTGLTGKYDFTLTWKPDNGPGGQDTGASDSNAPDLFTAVTEQLGLKLVSTKGPVDTLVIDNAEKPAEN